MNQYQQHLFKQLEDLIVGSDVFYRQEFMLDGARYWIYNYRLASYTEFLKPGAMECRGIMFEVDDQGQAIRLASMTMPKFFNLNENPLTMNLDLSLVDAVELKADGSLMSTYVHNNQLRFKSKGSLFSEQALDAIKWIESDPEFKFALYSADLKGYTVNLEWCAPHNRIVIGYADAHLMVLNARHRETGQYMDRADLDLHFWNRTIARVDTNGLDTASFVKSIPDMQDDIEGYVARIGDLWFKVKTLKYMSLHHAKDSINNPRRLFEAVVEEAADDLRSMFSHDALAMKQIDEMQERVGRLYNSMVAEVDSFYYANKDLSQKDYAIKGQQEVTRMYFGLVMNRKAGKTVDFKTFLKSKYKELGFRDTSLDKKDAE